MYHKTRIYICFAICLFLSFAFPLLIYSNEDASPTITPKGFSPQHVAELISGSDIGFISGNDVLIIQDILSWGINSSVNADACQQLGITFDLINSSSFGSKSVAELANYKAIILASDQDTNYYDIMLQNKDKLLSYVSNGGFLLADIYRGWNNYFITQQFLPGGATPNFEDNDDASFLLRHYLVANPKRPVSDPNSTIDNLLYSSSVYFTNLPIGTITVGWDGFGRTTIAEYSVGNGRVLLVGIPIEWFYRYKLGLDGLGVNANNIKLLYNEIEYAIIFRPLTAVDDLYIVNKNTVLNVSVPGVLGNDQCIYPMTAIKVTNPTNGTVTLNPNGSFTYTPTANYVGLDSFTYKVNDGMSDSNVATVNLKVNGPPTAVDDGYRVSKNIPLIVSLPGVLGNDSDPNGDLLTAVKAGNPAHGTVTLNPNGSFTYTPVTNYAGWDSFAYRANDGLSNSNTATVWLKVNEAPVANNDSYKVNKNTVLTIPAKGVLANDTDLNNDLLTAIKVTNPANGTMTLNPNGSFTYTPTTNYIGLDSFTYKANDGLSDSNTATVWLKVNGIPVAVADGYRADKSNPLKVLAPGVLANDSDPDGEILAVIKVSNPANGTVILNANGSFTYTPSGSFVGWTTFTYKAYDGLSYSNTVTVWLKVNAPPVAMADGYRAYNNIPLTVTAPGVLANDSDPDGDPLTAIKVSNPANGTVNLNANGSFTYTPSGSFVGWTTFTYKAYDGLSYSNAVTIWLKVNTPPVAIADGYRTSNITPLTVAAPGVLANDTDPDGDLLTAIKVSNPTNGTVNLNANGSFTYTPSGSFVGWTSFTYKANDGLVNSNTTTVWLKVNGPPIAINDGFYYAIKNTPLIVSVPGVLVNDTDPNKDPLTAIKVSNPTHGAVTLSANGSFTYTPAFDYVGRDSFTYKANDGLADSGVATVAIVVNGPPVAAADGYNVIMNTPLTVSAPGVLGNDTDPNGDPLKAIKVGNPTHGTVAFNANGSFTYTPTLNYTGWDTFTYRANDGMLNSNTVTVWLKVNAPAALLANYPNPFNPETWIPFSLSNDTNVEIMIYSSNGQLVRKLDLGYKSSGSYLDREKSAYWDGKNESGEYVSSGIYFYTIKAGNFVDTCKMVMKK